MNLVLLPIASFNYSPPDPGITAAGFGIGIAAMVFIFFLGGRWRGALGGGVASAAIAFAVAGAGRGDMTPFFQLVFGAIFGIVGLVVGFLTGWAGTSRKAPLVKASTN